DGTVASFSVYADQGVDQTTLRDRIADTLTGTDGLEVVTRTQLVDETTARIDKQLGFVTTFLLVFAALALFVGAFIIANTFTMSVRQRMREFALLRAVGASPAQVFTSLLTQAAVIGLIGSGLGVLAGLGLVQGLKVVFAQMGMTLSDQIPLRASTVAIAVAVGTLTCLAATLLPARRAALVPPVEAMSEQTSITEKSLRWRGLGGLVLLLGGVAVVLWAVANPTADNVGAAIGVGAAATLVAVLVLGPVVVPAIVRFLAVPLVRWFRPIGRLASGNVVRNPRRAANTAGALTIGMALVGAASVLAASTQASVAGMIDQQVTADFVLRADYPDTVGDAVVTGARRLDGVQEVDPLSYALVDVDGKATSVAQADPALIGRSLHLPAVQGDPAQALTAGELVVQKTAADAAGWAVGDRLTLTGSAGTRELTIGAVQDSALMGAVQAPPGVLTDLVAAAEVQTSTALVALSPGADAAEVRTELVDLVKPYVVVSVMDSAEFVDSMASQVDQVLAILYALLGLSIVIAVLGIVNTLALSVVERTREIGLLRAVGLGRLQLAGTVTVESVLTAVTGTLIGLAVGVGLAAALPQVYADQGLSVLAVPWADLVAMVALAVVVGVVAALWPGVRAARLKVLDAVSYE
ncbi:MAG: FtsX-like permease family protein, partial [Actinobacteria bacterium]|nr:FtsX-like permease family protein [Actinomycetota bacterium]MCG2802652.1 FtsX-like permease family protein [Cellulomonas sp.]